MENSDSQIKASSVKKEKIVAESDAKQLVLYIWDEVENPVCVLQIAHGMAEHMGRYDDFARFLNQNGIIAAGFDHRSHGETDPDSLGKVDDDGDLFSQTIADMAQLNALLRQRYNLPVIILGHSYGSFLVQGFMDKGVNADGIILTGSAFNSGFMLGFASFFADQKAKSNRNSAGKTFASMTFEKYDKKVRDGINGWLSRDRVIVGKYNIDPYCGFVCSNGFYQSFFKGLCDISKSNFSNTRKDMPIFIASGDKDMVGENGRLVKKLNDRLVGFGFSPTTKLYKDARHEILNETNKQEVYDDILRFILSATNTKP